MGGDDENFPEGGDEWGDKEKLEEDERDFSSSPSSWPFIFVASLGHLPLLLRPFIIALHLLPLPLFFLPPLSTSSFIFRMQNSSSSSSASASSSPPPPDLAHLQRSTAELVEILIYSLCLLVGGPLNLFAFPKLVTRLFRPSAPIHRTFGTQIALLKLHLNIADLITMFIYTLSQIIWMVSYQWHAGDLLCRLCKFFHTFGFYLNSFVVACFAIDRFLGTRNLNNPSATTAAHQRVRRMLVVAWLLATLLSIPQCFIFRVFEPSELANFKQCTPIWTILGYELDIQLGTLRNINDTHRQDQLRGELIGQFEEVLKWERAYNLAHLLFVFWIPALVIVSSYASILITLQSLSVVPQSIRRTASPRIFRHHRRRVPSASSTTNNVVISNGTCDQSKQEKLGTQNGKTTERAKDEERERGPNGKMEQQQKLMMEEGEEEQEQRNGEGRRSGARVGALAAQTIAKARQNAKRQAALILAAYLTFWSPYNLLAIINAFASKEGSVREIVSISLPFLNSLIVVNPIVNPLIYGVFECGRKL